MQKKDVTIYDLADKLALSPGTVSRALKGHPAISKNTKAKIFQLAEKMGYHTNTFARNLRNQNTQTIGVIVHRLDSYFVSTLLSGIENTARDFGYQVIICQSAEQVQKEAKNAHILFNSRVDGLLVSLSYDTDNLSHFDAFLKKKIPLIFFDRIADYGGCLSILIDNRKAAYVATRHLIEQGCRRIVHLTAASKRNVYADRLEGYRQALSEADIPFRKELILADDLSQEAGWRAAGQILQMIPQPDAVFASNDNCASACMIALKAAGRRIPEDIAIAGFNNDPVCKLVQPNLTTIHYPAYEMGQVAAGTLINQITGAQDHQSTSSMILKTELMVRESSLRISKGEEQ